MDARQKRSAVTERRLHPLDHVELPERACMIEGGAHDVAHELGERDRAARARQRDAVDVESGIEVGVILPVRQPDTEAWRDDALAEPRKRDHASDDLLERSGLERTVQADQRSNDHRVGLGVHSQPRSIDGGDRHAGVHRAPPGLPRWSIPRATRASPCRAPPRRRMVLVRARIVRMVCKRGLAATRRPLAYLSPSRSPTGDRGRRIDLPRGVAELDLRCTRIARHRRLGAVEPAVKVAASVPAPGRGPGARFELVRLGIAELDIAPVQVGLCVGGRSSWRMAPSRGSRGGHDAPSGGPTVRECAVRNECLTSRAPQRTSARNADQSACGELARTARTAARNAAAGGSRGEAVRVA